MGGSVSDFDKKNIFILFMKLEMKSCSRLGSKHKQIMLGAVLFMYLLTNTNIARIDFFYDQTCCWRDTQRTERENIIT